MILVQLLVELSSLGKQFPNLCMVKVQLLPFMFEPVRLCCLYYFVLQASKGKNSTFSLEFNHHNATTNELRID